MVKLRATGCAALTGEATICFTTGCAAARSGSAVHNSQRIHARCHTWRLTRRLLCEQIALPLRQVRQPRLRGVFVSDIRREMGQRLG